MSQRGEEVEFSWFRGCDLVKIGKLSLSLKSEFVSHVSIVEREAEARVISIAVIMKVTFFNIFVSFFQDFNFVLMIQEQVQNRKWILTIKVYFTIFIVFEKERDFLFQSNPRNFWCYSFSSKSCSFTLQN